jgi:hypothetical protein
MTKFEVGWLVGALVLVCLMFAFGAWFTHRKKGP